MKRIILVLFVIISIHLQASAGNFITNDGKLVWQGVFETTMDIEQLEKTLVNSGRFVDIVNAGDIITFWCRRANLDPREFGYSIGSTPIYITGNDVDFFCTIQVKEGRYRATAELFTLTNNRTGGLLKEGETEKLEAYAVDVSGKLKKGFSKRPAEIYDKFLTKLLTLQEKEFLNSEW